MIQRNIILSDNGNRAELNLLAVNDRALVLEYICYKLLHGTVNGKDYTRYFPDPKQKVVVKRHKDDAHDPVRALAYALLECFGFSKTGAKKFIKELLEHDASAQDAPVPDAVQVKSSDLTTVPEPTPTPATEPIKHYDVYNNWECAPMKGKHERDRMRRYLKDYINAIPEGLVLSIEWWVDHLGYNYNSVNKVLTPLILAGVLEPQLIRAKSSYTKDGRGYRGYKRIDRVLTVMGTSSTGYKVTGMETADKRHKGLLPRNV